MSEHPDQSNGELLGTLGRAFATYCNKHAEVSDCDGFVSFLIGQGITASVYIIYQREAGDEVYYSDRLSSPAIYWRVQVGASNYLLPRPVNAEQFYDYKGMVGSRFQNSVQVEPRLLGECTPAVLAPHKDYWVVAEYGHLANSNPMVAAETTESPEYQPSVREKIGLCFMDFCQREHANYEPEEFEQELRQMVPEAKVQVGYRRSSSQEPYFDSARPHASNSKGWVVTAGDELFLLPCALSDAIFDTVIECFQLASETTPKNLKDCLPARLSVNGKRWGVTDPGRLGTQPDKTLQGWLAEKRKMQQPVADMANATTMGQAYVEFCHLVQNFSDSPTVDDFLAALNERFPRVKLNGILTTVGVFNVWLVIKGEASQAKKGWLLPAIKSLNEFHPFGESYFISEGTPSPATVAHVQPVKLWHAPGEEGKPWRSKQGRVSDVVSPKNINAEEEIDDALDGPYGRVTLREAIGMAFIQFCRENQGLRLTESERFERLLKQEYPDAKVIAVCHDPAEARGSVYVEFLRGPGAWLVHCEDQSLLVPAPTDDGLFEKMDGFQVKGKATAKTAKSVRPAVVLGNQFRWTVAESGTIQ